MLHGLSLSGLRFFFRLRNIHPLYRVPGRRHEPVHKVIRRHGERLVIPAWMAVDLRVLHDLAVKEYLHSSLPVKDESHRAYRPGIQVKELPQIVSPGKR